MDEITNVLLIEDSAEFASATSRLIGTATAGQIQVTCAERLGDALSCLSTRQFDAILLDLGLPDSRGLETFRKVRAHAPDLPIVILTADDDEQHAIQSVKEGAQDWFLKEDVNPRLITRAIRHAVERKRAEEENQRLREVIESAPASIAVHGLNGDFVYANRRARELGGYSRDEFLALNVLQVAIPGDDAFTAAHLQKIVEEGEDVFEVNCVRREGELFPAEIRAQLVRWGDDRAVLVIATDITERRKTDNDLRETRDFLENLVNHANAPIIVWDPEHRITRFNHAFEVLTGYASDEVIGKSLDLLFPDADRAESLAEIARTLSGQRWESVEIPILCKSGAVRTALWNSANLYGRDGVTLVATIAQGQDITERKRAEEERLALERQLLHSQKLESLGVLAGGIAHDFNNLLQVVLGNIEMAEKWLAPGSSAHLDLDEAVRAVNSAADLTRQMLAYAGKGRFVIQEVNLNDLVAENAFIFRTAISRTVDLQSHLGPGLPPILADAAQMQQVLMNMLTNASEAIGEGPGNVTLSTGMMDCDAGFLSQSRLEEKPAPGQFVWLEVTDDGCGMDEETQQRLFEPFYTTKFTGRGLGLSAVMGIVRGHHGALMLRSDLGRGATIRILFPALRREGASVAEVKAAGPGVAAPIVSGMGIILVVDDEPAVRLFCAKVVRSQGFDVLTAQDGEEAVRLFREHKETIRCTLLDYTMPRMSGLATFQEIRRISPDAKVILCSGYREEDATEGFRGRGLAGFLQKPYRLDAVKAMLGEVLKSKANS